MIWLDDITDPVDMLQSVGLQRVVHNLATEQPTGLWMAGTVSSGGFLSFAVHIILLLNFLYDCLGIYLSPV